ncbi:MAG: hypothetical protein PUK40_00905 [Actinomycetaceae bacterium]|nr:hypothetical protein [Arcanobacterium sp.]MDD7504499.1 hypothetical protein [Actinomycetaceae bacterium]MDY6142832.1 hypothetical protein [Arcanobacterium sp.]
MSARFGISVIWVVCLAFVSGCSEPVDDASAGSETSGLNLEAEIDPETSSVILPGDRFKETEHETWILQSAASAKMAQCAREKYGIPWVAVSSPATPLPSQTMWYELGPWTQQMANEFGNAKPMTEAELVANGYIEEPADFAARREEKPHLANASLPDDVINTVTENCNASITAPELHFGDSKLYSGPGQQELNNSWELVKNDERATQAFDDLRQCYENRGLKVSNSGDAYFPFTVAGVDPYTINEQQILLANEIVACKDETDFIQRIVKIWAEKQAPIIEQYADELVAQRKTIDDGLDEAETFIASHPDLFQTVR